MLDRAELEDTLKVEVSLTCRKEGEELLQSFETFLSSNLDSRLGQIPGHVSISSVLASTPFYKLEQAFESDQAPSVVFFGFFVCGCIRES